MRRGRAVASLFVVLVAVVLCGCGIGGPEEQDPRLPSPDARGIEELEDQSAPIYWLGRSFRGLPLSGVEISPAAVVVAYGVPKCGGNSFDGRYCEYPVTISSGEERGNPFFPPAGRWKVCIDHVESALLISACRRRQVAGVLYSGGFRPGSASGLAVRLESRKATLGIQELAVHLRLANPVQMEELGRVPDRDHPLPPPAPISCPALRFVVRWWTRMVEKEFGPNPNCRPYGS